MMALIINSILNKFQKNDSTENMKETLKEELKKFEDHCEKDMETYKKLYSK